MQANALPVVYTRRLSQQDVEDGSILITRDSWEKFPPAGVSFHIFVLGEDYRAQIEARESAAQQNYRLRAEAFISRLDWREGAVLHLRKLEEESYLLEPGATA